MFMTARVLPGLRVAAVAKDQALKTSPESHLRCSMALYKAHFWHHGRSKEMFTSLRQSSQ